MLDELKSKLGFGGGAVRGRSNDRYDDYDDDYGDYEDDYSEYAEYADDSENDYDPYAPVTTRSARIPPSQTWCPSTTCAPTRAGRAHRALPRLLRAA